MLDVIHNGLGLTDIALFLNRVVLGAFFVLARFRFFWDPSKPHGSRWLNADRHSSLTHKMEYCGLKNKPYAWAWVVAIIEVGAGIWLILGFATAFAGLGLFLLTLRATFCTAKQKVFEQKPVDTVDICACYLWRVEGLYILAAFICVIAGPGAFALSSVLS